MTIRHFAACASLALVAAFFSGCGSSGPTISVLAPKDAVLLMVIQGDAIRNNPDLKPLVDAGVRANSKMQKEFDPLSVSEIQLSLVPKPAGDRTPGPFLSCCVIKFKQPIDAAVKQKMDKGLGDADHAGKKYKRDASGFMASYQIDPQTVVVGQEIAIKSCMDNSNPPPALLEAINRPGIKGQIRMAYAPGAEKAMLNDFKKPPFSQMMPPPVFRLLDVPNHVTLVALSLHVSGDEFLRIEMDTPGGTSTTEVKDRLTGALDFSKETVNALIDFQLANMPMPADQKALAKPFINETLGKLKVVAEGSRVVLSLPVSAELGKMMRDNSAKVVKQIEDGQKGAVVAVDRNRDRNMMMQLGLSAHSHESSFRKLPDDLRDPTGKAILSWRVAVLPYAEEQSLFQQIDKKQAWDSPQNLSLAGKIPAVYEIRGAPPIGPVPRTNIMRFVGAGTLYDGKRQPKFSEVTDGASNTILYVMAGTSVAVPWSQPADLPFDLKNPIRALGNIPPQGFQAVMFDGSVKVIPATISPQALAALICPYDGIPITWSPSGAPTIPPGSEVKIDAPPARAGANPQPGIVPPPGTNPQPGIPMPPPVGRPGEVPVPRIQQPMPAVSGGPPMSATLYFANNDDQRGVDLFVNGQSWKVPGAKFNKHGLKFKIDFKGGDVIVAQTSDRGKGELAWLLVDSTGKVLSYSKVGALVHLKSPEFAEFAIGRPGRSSASAAGFVGLASEELKGEVKGVAIPADLASIWAPKQDEPNVAVRVYPAQ